MKKDHPIREILAPRTKDKSTGIISVCSANGYVLEACMERTLKSNNYFLVEATCNQVNQFGGYIGMRPIDYKAFVYKIAERVSFAKEKIIKIITERGRELNLQLSK